MIIPFPKRRKNNTGDEDWTVHPGTRALAFTHEDDDAYRLQIELANDCAVLIAYWKNGDLPSISLWHGSGESMGLYNDLKKFKEFAEIATALKSW